MSWKGDNGGGLRRDNCVQPRNFRQTASCWATHTNSSLINWMDFGMQLQLSFSLFSLG